MDGRFASPESWNVPEDLTNLDGKVKLEVHLMVREPEEILKQWMGFVDRVLVHVESTDHLAEILEGFDGSPSQFGVVLKLDTPIDILDDFAGKIDRVQLMSISELGHYGAKFEEISLDRVAETRNKYPAMRISVDGGINLENAPKLIEAGADDLVIGSAIWNADGIAGAIKKFQTVS
jgi:ribulose-phosphate 3-epimerase